MKENDVLKPRVGLLWACGITPPRLVKNAFRLVLMALLLINLSHPVYSQVKGKWKFPVNLVLSPDYYTESRVMELRFGSDTIYYSLESKVLRNDDLIGTLGFQGYPDDANFNFFNYYDSLYRNPFDLREDSIFVNGQRTALWGKDYAALYYESFRNGKILDLNGAGDYCIIHSLDHGLSDDHDFGYHIIHKQNSIFTSSTFSEIFQQEYRALHHMENFDVLENPDGSRNLVAISNHAQFNTLPPSAGMTNGIISFPITNSGINLNGGQVIDSIGNFFEKADFSTWQFEGKYLNGASSPTFIWCSTSVPYPLLPTNPNCRGNFYVKGPGYKYKHVLNLGNIAGVAFSEINPGYAYVSVGGTSSPYVASGIYKVNIQTGAYTSITTGNYGHSWLKKAPDGHIYAVSDNGETLGRVNQTTGLFEVAFHFPTVDVQGETHQIRYGTYQLMDDNKRCFTLPDDDHMANCPEVIGVGFNTTECNYIRTSVTITGGIPPYQIIWQKWDNSTWTTLPYNTQYVDNLAAGHYRVLVTDANQAGGWFTYEFDVPVNNNVFNDMTVTSGNTINYSNQNLNVRTEIRVKPNAKLNLTGCNVYFWPEAKLVIENGGAVVLNNTLLSSCDTMWQGIEVWGDKTKPQYMLNGQNWQGTLVMKHSTIENAKTAVALWRPNYYGTTGGIVKAENSVFRNNGKAVFACYYDNFYAVNGRILDNACRFYNCTFEINQDYKADVMFYKHVDLASVKGIKFYGCSFSVVQTEGVSPWNSGIASYNSGFTVNGYCSSAYLPCPDNSYIYSTFSGFNKGVYAFATDLVTDRTVSIMHSNFINNGTGVKLDKIASSVICYSNFSIGLSLGDIYSCGDTATGYGIYCDNSSGFAIEENDFRKASGTPTATYIGVYVTNSESADEIYRNSFTGLSFGNVANLLNHLPFDRWSGLVYYCNQNSLNYEDIRVTDDRRSEIQARQGDNHHTAGNTFSPNAVYNFNNLGGQETGYFYYYAEPNEFPVRVFHVSRELDSTQNLCLSHYGNTGSTTRNVVLSTSQRSQTELEFNLASDEWNNVDILYRSLVDGGNTQAFLADVKGSYPEEMLTIYNQLLARSPHLSREVLIAVADQTNVFPASAIFDIMMANPDELKRYDLISYLEEKPDPLPAYMIDVLRSVVGGSTYKTALQDQLSYYNRLKTRAANDIIRSILNDSISDLSQLRTWYGNLGGLRAGEQIVASYIQEGNYTQALSVANSFPSVYGIESEELDEYNMYLDLLNLEVNVAQQGRKIFDLTATEQENLSEVAEKSHGTAGVIARGILQYAYGYNYSQCSSFEVASYKDSKVVTPNSLTQARGLTVEIGPNPANQWVSVHYTLPLNEKEALLTIMDSQGRQLRSITVSGAEGQKLIDLRDLDAGLYLYTLTTKSLTNSGKLIISR